MRAAIVPPAYGRTAVETDLPVSLQEPIDHGAHLACEWLASARNMNPQSLLDKKLFSLPASVHKPFCAGFWLRTWQYLRFEAPRRDVIGWEKMLSDKAEELRSEGMEFWLSSGSKASLADAKRYIKKLETLNCDLLNTLVAKHAR